MFNLEFGGNGDTHPVTPELIKQSIEALEDAKQKDFILKCMETDPSKRPTAKQLLFHPLLFEVPSLRLLASHQLIKNQNESFKETNQERLFSALTRAPETLVATRNPYCSSEHQHHFKYSQLTPFDANRYLEDVKNGIYPLTAFGLDNQLSLNQQLQLKQTATPSTPKQSQSSDETAPIEPSIQLQAASDGDCSAANNTNSSSSNGSSLFVDNQSGNTSYYYLSSSSTSSPSSTSPSQSMSHVNIQPGLGNYKNIYKFKIFF